MLLTGVDSSILTAVAVIEVVPTKIRLIRLVHRT